jgi:hypothetical protein
MHVALVFGDAVEEGEILRHVDEALAIIGSLQEEQGFHDAEAIIFGGNFEVSEKLLGLADALETFEKGLGIGVFGEIEFDLCLFGAIDEAEGFGAHESDLERRFDGVVERAELGGQVEHGGGLGGGQLKAHGVVVLLVFAVVAGACFIHIDGDIDRRAAGEGFGKAEPWKVGRMG